MSGLMDAGPAPGEPGRSADPVADLHLGADAVQVGRHGTVGTAQDSDTQTCLGSLGANPQAVSFKGGGDNGAGAVHVVQNGPGGVSGSTKPLALPSPSSDG